MRCFFVLEKNSCMVNSLQSNRRHEYRMKLIHQESHNHDCEGEVCEAR